MSEPEDIITAYIFGYVLLNIILFVIYKFTSKFKIPHRILSVINVILLALLLGYGFYRVQPLFVIFVPCIFLVEFPIAWGLNKELSDEDAASLVTMRSPLPLKKENRDKVKVSFAHFATFPFFYLLDSWSKGE